MFTRLTFGVFGSARVALYMSGRRAAVGAWSGCTCSGRRVSGRTCSGCTCRVGACRSVRVGSGVSGRGRSACRVRRVGSGVSGCTCRVRRVGRGVFGGNKKSGARYRDRFLLLFYACQIMCLTVVCAFVSSGGGGGFMRFRSRTLPL